ncbi:MULTISPECIES: class I SAM-dependent methyltransferase [Streptomyces]|uniref:SAM-dependent methyltransferase n=1 Tax=Streptomyces qinglanensis TaxID=943816 RepID=A0A1E7K5U7_9ACTN|nr:class I SAM-dependent methyltransferase [Streptomyces qinglanensis]OEU99303.1 SAM-dependent methyltransferase [Streptomyces qinglanensis]
MTPLPHRILAALDRFNAAHPWDHNAHYHRWILRRIPRRFDRALDVGSGSGDLARLLATRAREVHAVDADPVLTARAAAATPAAAPVAFTVADAPAGLPAGPYDVLTCVAVLHHLPLGEALRAFRRRLAPGGTLVVVGCARARSAGDHALGAASVPLNVAAGWCRNRGRTAPPPLSMTAPARPPEQDFAEIAREARRILPGVHLRRRLFWRYTLVWRAEP